MARILVVDDSPTSRAIICRSIGPAHETVPCPDGASALAELSKGGYDLLLLDLLMPGMDGLQVLAALRERGPKIPVLVLTADIQDSTRARALELGASGLVNKPVVREVLLSAVAGVLAHGHGFGR